ncbi:sulfotransferase family protein [Yoonia sp.]|uniref:sulfotransferase family protein n=1 Tax=Yoonia sp. TaxID=2212373 RepID=UPI0035C7A5E2
MTLDVIGPGFGRTGTESMKRALEMLGFGPCYHMYEVLPHKERFETWQAIYDGTITPDWDAVFDGFRATVDWPGAYYWRELAVHFPDAKILLTYRDPESWYASMENTILSILRDPEKATGMAARLRRDVFDGDVESKAHVIATYERNLTDVQQAFGPDRLLSYALGSGWEPLCNFLGCDIPDAPYPSGNESASFHTKTEKLGDQREVSGDTA